MTKLLGSWDSLILGMLEHLGVELHLGVGLAVELASKLCSGRWPRQIRSNPCHWSGRVPVCLGPTGPVSPSVGDRCVLTSDPLILGALECLEVELPVIVVGLASTQLYK